MTSRREPAPTPKADATERSRIADLPSFTEMSSTVAVVKVLAKWVPRVAPVARLFGVDVNTMQRAVDEAARLAPQIEMQVGLPDRFNALYAPLGWVAYGALGQQVMIDAIAAGEAGDLSTGESLLVEHYTSDILDFQLMRMSSLRHFRDRVELARLAKVDYLEGRFHACIPNVLMLVDGLATDAARSNQNFFSEGADLTAWDSVEGHATGLPALAALMRTRRMKRSTENLTIPFRHGILHGRDLGFANKMVAAKSWAALFALGEWARKIERCEKEQPPPTPKPSFMESLREFVRKNKSQQRWRNWRPRNIVVGRDIPAVGTPDNYKLGAPERTLVEYLSLWRARNFGEMAKHVTIGVNKVAPRTRARDINRAYRPHKLESFALRAVEERGPMVASISAVCAIEGSGETEIQFLVVYEDAKGDWLYTEWDQGTWRVHNWSCVMGIAATPEQLDDL